MVARALARRRTELAPEPAACVQRVHAGCGRVRVLVARDIAAGLALGGADTRPAGGLAVLGAALGSPVIGVIHNQFKPVNSGVIRFSGHA